MKNEKHKVVEGSITLAGQSYGFEAFGRLKLTADQQWAFETQTFIKDWFSRKSHFEIYTSGSTGKPKQIRLHREQILSSALATISALALPAQINSLVAMDTRFIGGKMMIARGIIGRWHLHLLPPSAYPLPHCTSIHFTALVPMQVESLLKTREGLAFLNQLTHLIIGGAPISTALSEQIQHLNCYAWHTYGMTETVSHIALKSLNGDHKSDLFRVIGDNEIEVNEEECLRIRGTVTRGKWIETHDLVELHHNGFKWLGRNDLTVNSGGVKINIESAENDIRQKLTDGKTIDIALWKAPHPHYGEELVGLTNDLKACVDWKNQYAELKTHFKTYYFPKRWFYLNTMIRTGSGKLDRAASFKAAKEVENIK